MITFFFLYCLCKGFKWKVILKQIVSKKTNILSHAKVLWALGNAQIQSINFTRGICNDI